MDPEAKILNASQEQAPDLRARIESGAPARKPEELQYSPEKNKNSEINVAELEASAINQTAASSSVVATTTAVDDNDNNSTFVSDDANNLVADDKDIIEKEWLDKAKEIIASTKDNPHAREDRVGKLQMDYIEKRYKYKIGSAR